MRLKLLRTSALAAVGVFAAPAAFATSFTISNSSNTAQTLGSGSSQTGTITSSGTLDVSSNNVAVTISGNNEMLTNLGTLKQSGTGATANRAIRDNTGVTGLVVVNGSSTNSSATIETADGDVIQMNKPAGSVALGNYGQMISLNASGAGNQVIDFNAITTGANTVTNFATGVIRATEADAVRPGVNGVVNNYGLIKSTTTTGSSSDGVDAQNNSGVQITNYTTATGGGLIEGGRHGITGGALNASVNFSMSVTNQAGATIQGDNGSGINIDGFNGNELVTVVNNGVITGNGVTGDGDGVDVDGLVKITNTGTIRSINAFSAPADGVAFSEGITVGGGTITNSGTIQGSVTAGNTNAVGRGITLSGNDLTSGPYAGGRDPIYGDATVTNQSGGKIIGDSDSGIAIVGAYASGHTVTIDNQGGATIKGGGATMAAVDATQSFDAVHITNSGTIDGSSSGKAIALGSGANSVVITGGAVLGSIAGGSGAANTLTLDIGSGKSFGYTGAISQFASTEVKSGTANLGGGIAGPLTVDAGATLSPGENGAGVLAVGSADLKAGSTLAVDINPNGASGLLNVTGLVSLSGANLVLQLLSAPTLGKTFDILINHGEDAISGLFNQGQSVEAMYSGREYTFKIDYAYNADGGAFGNDIAVTAAAPGPVAGAGLPALLGLGAILIGYVRTRKRGLALPIG